MTGICQEISLTLDQYSGLEKLHLHFNLPEPAIICTLCGYALAADDDRVGRHLGEKHWLRDHIHDNLSLQSWTLNDVKRAWIVTEPVRVGAAKSRSGDRPLQPAPDSIQHFANQLLDEERKRLGLHSPPIELRSGGL